jgi:hypothetical protein
MEDVENTMCDFTVYVLLVLFRQNTPFRKVRSLPLW